MNKNEKKNMRMKIFSIFFFIESKSKAKDSMYTSNVSILGIAKEIKQIKILQYDSIIKTK